MPCLLQDGLSERQLGHMSPITATNFIAASIGVLFLALPKEERQLYKNAAAFLAVCMISAGFIVIIGHLYGSPIFGHYHQ